MKRGEIKKKKKKKNSSLSPVENNRDVLRNHMTVGKLHDEVDLELDLERLRHGRRAREQTRENHEYGNVQVAAHVPLTHLNVLDFGGLLGPAVRAAASL